MSGLLPALGRFMLRHKSLWVIPTLVSALLVGTLIVVSETGEDRFERARRRVPPPGGETYSA